MIESKTDRARDLRRKETIFEKKFWALVRNRRLGGLKFKRQVPIGPYFADFFCEEAALIIELDGDEHGKAEGEARDLERDEYLRAHGFEVFRIWNNDFMRDQVATIEHVLFAANQRISARPYLLTRKR